MQAVRDVETRWSEAFVSGDARTLGQLLSDDYVSVSAKGESRTRQDVIVLATRYAAQHPGAHAPPLTADSHVSVVGDTALVRHLAAGQVSVDVLYRRHGTWVAWYSQHTAKPVR